MGADMYPSLLTATIASGASLSSAMTLPKLGGKFCGFTVDGWTSAVTTFAVSHDDSTYFPLIDPTTGAEYQVPTHSAVASGANGIPVEPSYFFQWRYVKVRSGTNGSAVTQGADRAITATIVPV